MQHELAIGVDLGGTKIAFALVNKQGEILAQHRLPTLPEEGTDAVLARIAEGIRHIEAQAIAPVAGVGIGSPGFVDAKNGVVVSAVNLYWHNVALKDSLQQQIGKPVYVENDVNALGIGEMTFGIAKGHDNFLYFAVGTGFGSCAIANGQLIHGSNQMAMEIGHTQVSDNGRLCACGQHGCLETIVSGNGIKQAFEDYRGLYPNSPLAQLSSVTPSDIVDYMRRDDPLACKIHEDIVYWLRYTMMWCVGIFNPSLFIIGGGLGLAIAPFTLDKLRVQLAEKTPLLPQQPQIALATIHESAVGPACLVWKNEIIKEKL